MENTRDKDKDEEEKVAAIVPCERSTTNKKQTKRTTKGERTRARARIAHHERLVESVEHLSLFSLSDDFFFLSEREVKGIQKCCLGFQSHTKSGTRAFWKRKTLLKIFKFGLSQTKRERDKEIKQKNNKKLKRFTRTRNRSHARASKT